MVMRSHRVGVYLRVLISATVEGGAGEEKGIPREAELPGGFQSLFTD